MPRHSAAAATPAAARPLQRGQNRVTAAPSPCTSGAVQTIAPAHGTDWPASLTSIFGRRHLRDVAPEATRGQLAHAYWETKPHNASFLSFPIRIKARRFRPDKCNQEVVNLACGKVGCALWVWYFFLPLGRCPVTRCALGIPLSYERTRCTCGIRHLP